MIDLNYSAWEAGYAENPHVIFNADNVQTLKKLHCLYDGKVSCIYIDPPYNNGEKYTFYSDALSHDIWLQQMKETLIELKPFLSEDGSIWMSIDDGEMHLLLLLYGNREIQEKIARHFLTIMNTFWYILLTQRRSKRSAIYYL